MKSHHLFITQSAKNDLKDIWAYAANNDSVNSANKIINKLENHCSRLMQLPERGRIVPEMRLLGINHFREIQCNPYRIIYEIKSDKILILSILDGRRNLDESLRTRLLQYNM